MPFLVAGTGSRGVPQGTIWVIEYRVGRWKREERQNGSWVEERGGS